MNSDDAQITEEQARSIEQASLSPPVKIKKRYLQSRSVRSKRVEEYEIRGNKYIAIAINVNDPTDAHYFTIDPEVNNDAFVRATGWAYEPPSCCTET